MLRREELEQKKHAKLRWLQSLKCLGWRGEKNTIQCTQLQEKLVPNMPSLYHSWLWTWFDFYFEILIWNTDMNISACMNKRSVSVLELGLCDRLLRCSRETSSSVWICDSGSFINDCRRSCEVTWPRVCRHVSTRLCLKWTVKALSHRAAMMEEKQSRVAPMTRHTLMLPLLLYCKFSILLVCPVCRHSIITVTRWRAVGQVLTSLLPLKPATCSYFGLCENIESHSAPPNPPPLPALHLLVASNASPTLHI